MSESPTDNERIEEHGPKIAFLVWNKSILAVSAYLHEVHALRVMHSKRVRDAFETQMKCTRNAHEMHSKCSRCALFA